MRFLILFLALAMHMPLWSAEADEQKLDAAEKQAYALLEKLDTETLIKEFGTLTIPGVFDHIVRTTELQIRIVEGKNQTEDRRIALKHLKDPATSPACKRMISQAFALSKDLGHLTYVLDELRLEKDARKRGPLYWDAADNKNPAISTLAEDLVPQAEQDKLHPHPTVGNGADGFLRAIRQQGLDKTRSPAWIALNAYLKEHGGGKVKDVVGEEGIFMFVVMKDDQKLYFRVVLKDDAWVITPEAAP